MKIMMPFFTLVLIGIALWCFARIVSRTGRSGWWAFAMVLPGINILLVWLFAYAPWPRFDYAAEPEGDNLYMPPGATQRHPDSAGRRGADADVPEAPSRLPRSGRRDEES